MANEMTPEQWRAYEAGEKSLAEIDRENERKRPSKRKRNVRKGKAAKRSGDVLERDVDVSNDLLRKQGRAHVFKVPTPLRIEGHISGAKVRARKEPARWVDYCGVLAGGQAVAFECKSVQVGSDVDDRLVFSRVPEHQRGVLESVASHGGLAFVLIGVVRGSVVQDRYVMPVDSKCRFAGMDSERGSFVFEKWQDLRVPNNGTWLDVVG